MKPILMIGTSIVNIALIAYSIFLYHERKYRSVTPKLLAFLTIGVFFDLTATICMIIGSTKSPFTVHGILGYSAFAAMFIDTILMWQKKTTNGINSNIPKALHVYSLMACIWWILAYITGALIVMLR